MEIALIITFVITLGMAYLSRAIGAPKGELLPEWLNPFKDFIWGIPFVIVTVVALKGTSLGILWIILLSVLTLGGATLSKRMGHGQYMDLGTWTKKIEPQRIDPLVEAMWGVDRNTLEDNVKGNYWRDFTGLAITGLVGVLIPSTILLVTGHPLLALLVLLGGALKAVGYFLGWWLWPNKATEVGETLTGAFVGVALGIVLIVLL